MALEIKERSVIRPVQMMALGNIHKSIERKSFKKFANNKGREDEPVKVRPVEMNSILKPADKILEGYQGRTLKLFLYRYSCMHIIVPKGEAAGCSK